jgi:hypothetical protein
MSHRAATAAALLIGLSLHPALGHAARCPAPAGAAAGLADLDAGARLAWIDAHLTHTAHTAKVWTWGWGAGIATATVANLVPLLFVDRESRIDWYVGAATTAVGIVPLLIAPLDVIEDARALHARVAAMPSTGEDVCVVLADAEVRLARDAQNQADGQRWWLHVGNVVLNTGVGLFLGLGYNHWKAGAFNIVVGSAIGEAIILTQPTGSIGDFAAYHGGRLDGRAGASAGAGLTFGGSF